MPGAKFLSHPHPRHTHWLHRMQSSADRGSLGLIDRWRLNVHELARPDISAITEACQVFASRVEDNDDHHHLQPISTRPREGPYRLTKDSSGLTTGITKSVHPPGLPDRDPLYVHLLVFERSHQAIHRILASGW